MNIEQLKEIMPSSTKRNRELFIKPLNDAMEEFEINTHNRMAAFLAQLAHESGSLQYMEELASGSAYEYRADLGNLKPEALAAAHAHGSTTGKFYKGYGPIQITGYDNYLKCGIALGIDLVNNPKLLTQPVHGCRSAAWFWKSHGLNELADLGRIKRISRIINGGTNGLSERIAFYETASKVLA